MKRMIDREFNLNKTSPKDIDLNKSSTGCAPCLKAALKIDKTFWYSSSGLIQAKRSGYTLYNKAFYFFFHKKAKL